MRIIFIDPERCLTDLTSLRKSQISLNTSCVIALNDLVGVSKAKLVLTSDRRWKDPMVKQRRRYADQGLFGDIIDRTPELAGHERWVEILTWLDMVDHHVDSFVIIDDTEMGPLQPKTVLTRLDTGFCLDDVQPALARFLV